MSRLALIFALTLVFISPFASADIPHLISLQGKLTDASDNPISSSTNFVFKIFPSETGGTALWTEFQTIAPDTLGIFSALLGSVAALNIPFNESYWLEVQVNSEILSPRTRMGSAGYALRSESPWNATGNNIYTTNSGNVGIGTVSPDAKFVVKGSVAGDFVRIVENTGTNFIALLPSTSLHKIYTNEYSGGDVPLVLGTYANQNNQLYLATNGNVGMGTAIPGQKLTVAGDDNWTGTLQGGAVPWARLSNIPNYAGSSSPGGPATTATALASNGANCGAGQYAQGVDAGGNAEGCSAPAGGVTGSGTANYIPKWTAGTALGNSAIYDNGNVGIGTASPGQKLTVAGTIESTSGGIKFPDGTTQAKAAIGGTGTARLFTVSSGGSCPSGSYELSRKYASVTCNGCVSCTTPGGWVNGGGGAPSCGYGVYTSACYARTCYASLTEVLCVGDA